MHSEVRLLARAALNFASHFPVVTMRNKMHHNVREMFIAHRHVNCTKDVAALVKKGWIHLETMQAIQLLDTSDAHFRELLSRKK